MKLNKRFALTLVLSLFGASVGGGALSTTANAADKTSNFDFASCVQSQKSGNVMLLMDESGSIYGDAGSKASDPKNYRITAAKIMVDKLQAVADAYDSKINLLLAGFGDEFKIRSNGNQGWLEIKPGGSPDTIAKLDTAAKNWEKKPGDGNYGETDMYSALEGAQKSFASVDSCKLLVLFKDGSDYQSFNKQVDTEVTDLETQGFLDSKNINKANDSAERQICRAQGLADGFRSTETFVLSVALGSGDFQKLRNLTEGGGNCGALQGYGKLLQVTDPAELPARFARSLDPSFVPASRENNFTFNMTNALSGIGIMTTGDLSAFNEYTITPPATCVGGKAVFKQSGANQGSFGQGVDWNSKWYSKDTFQIAINKAEEATDSCWVGKWTVQPTGSSASKSSSVLQFDANLQAVPAFSEKDFYLTPGGTPKDFSVALRKVTPNSAVVMKKLDKSLSLSVSARVENFAGEVKSQVFSNLNRDALENTQKLEVGDLALGKYRLVLQLDTSVANLGVPLRPVRTEQIIEVRNKSRAPQVQKVVAFGDIDGRNPATKEVQVKQSPDAAYKLELGPKSSSVRTSQSPEGLTYKFAGAEANSVEIPKGNGVSTFSVSIQAATKGNLNKQGLVAGELQIKAIPVGSESNADVLGIPFTANQKAEANVGLQWLFIFLFTILGLAATLGALQFVSWLIAKFPRDADVASRNIKAFVAIGTIQNGAFTSSDLDGVTNDMAWKDILVSANRKTADLANFTFNAKSAGWRLGSSGYGQLTQSNTVGWGSGLDDGETRESSTQPEISLHLQRSWLVMFDKSSLPQSAEGIENASIPATILLVMGQEDAMGSDGGFALGGSNSSSGEKERMLAEVQTTISRRLPGLVQKFAGLRKLKPAKKVSDADAYLNQSTNDFSITSSKDPNDPFA